MTECAEDEIRSPERTLIESGVELYWSCCDTRVALQRSTPFRIYPETIPYYHSAALEMKNGEHV